MKRLTISLLVGMACLAGAEARAQAWGNLSDVLAVSLPALAGFTSLRNDDQAGTAQLALTLAGTLVSAEALKSQVHATRPDGSGTDSFPSGHTAIAFASARFIHKRYGDDISPTLLYGAAALTAAARVQANRHYWGDTAAGAALGFAMAEYFTDVKRDQTLSVWPAPGGFALSWRRNW